MPNPSPIHTRDWHISDYSFPNADEGLPVPNRSTSCGGAVLQIQNLDRSDPPGYRPGSMPRSDFNRNIFNVSAVPCMPSIPVICSVAGFDPATNPIQWRLVCRHVLCRYTNQGHYRYKSAFDVFEREWRGESRAAHFTIFGNGSSECSCTYSDQSHVMGGHGIFQVAALVGGAVLSDFVHVRIGAQNPTPDDVVNYLRPEVGDPNVATMMAAILAHENNFRQFSSDLQSKALMTFSNKRGYHDNPEQPDCPVTFTWPADPPNFPSAGYDYGVGISQYTRVAGQSISSDIAWDWRENIRTGTNLFLQKLRSRLKAGMTWRECALAAWAAYNGAGAAAEQYAATLAASPNGLKVSDGVVPGTFEVVMLKAPTELPQPGSWLVESSSAIAV